MMDDDGWIPYPRFIDKVIVLRDRTGIEYRGYLRFWKKEFVKLETETDEIFISRTNGNIVALIGPRLKEVPRDAKVNRNSQGKR